MKKLLTLVFIISVFFASTKTFAGTIVNVGADGPTGVGLNLSAGDYLVSWIGTANGGAYNAWSAWNGFEGWLNNFNVKANGVDTGYGIGSYPFYATPAEALAAAQSSSFHLILPTDQLVQFYIGDNPYSDNRGGISLDVTVAQNPVTVPEPVPEPSTFLLLGAGFGGLAFWRRKKTV